MDPNTPMVLAGAKYATRSAAVSAFETVWGARHQGEYDHMAVAVLTKNADGDLQVERHDSTAKHLAWGGALLGAALCVVAPPVGIAVVAAGAGAGGLIGHFWHAIPEDKVAEISQLLKSGESGLIIVAVNHREIDITPLLGDAEKTVVVETKAGDLDAAFDNAVKKAEAAKTTAAASS